MAARIEGHRLRAIVGGSLGNLVEWYDWFAYASLAIYFAPRFFPRAIPRRNCCRPPRSSRSDS